MNIYFVCWDLVHPSHLDSISWWSFPYPTTHVWVWNEVWSGVYGPIFFIPNWMKLYFICYVDVVEAINWMDV